MNLAQIESNLQQLVSSLNNESFIYDLLLAYGHPKASITRLQHGGLNLSKAIGEVAWKKKVFFKSVQDEDIHEVIAGIKENDLRIKHDPRFIVVTDFKTLLAIDRRTFHTLDIPITEIAKHFDFFLPWAGMEKAQRQSENPADVKAAERMAKLYDEIKKDNITSTHEEVHNLNVFLSRLLFCFFAEDTDIFEKAQFTTAIESHTQEDGSDLSVYLEGLFDVMNTDYDKRRNLSAYQEAFPYVNGGLFKNKHRAPIFTRRSRQILIESGKLDWSAINPDIFGSMIQAVITPEHREGLGMHYTSVPNIMKVIGPLFLDELQEELEISKNTPKKLNALLNRIWSIKIFDPACGSGNFLIIAYKELRRLEMKIFKIINSLALSNISLGNFYGIELDDFAHEVAILSLWLAEHQMNQEFFKEFGRTKPALPLKETGNIIRGNATQIDWQTVCPKKGRDEIYILGNPPYLGTRNQKKEHKDDVSFVLGHIQNYKTLDYIACWFYKASNYILGYNSSYAFVTTNSISQGDQVSVTWNTVLLNWKLEIYFAHQSFKWENNAKSNAGVSVLIIGVRNINNRPKYLFNQGLRKIVSNINPYIVDGPNLIISRMSNSISGFPKMIKGSIPADGGHLIIDEAEFKRISKNGSLMPYLKKFIGAQEIIDKINRWCLYIPDEDAGKVSEIEFIRNRLEGVKIMRLKSTKIPTQKLAAFPHRFAENRYINKPSIVIPCVTSEQRKYIPIDFVDKGPVIYASAQAIYEAPNYIFSIVTSSIHTIWIKAVCGSLETRIRYSSSLGYNTFPFPQINNNQKQELERHMYNVLEEREKHSEKTLAQLYNPDEMPAGLREAHHQLDLAVERCYRSKPFETDEERLAYLFKLYQQMINSENKKETLFETAIKKKRK
ncbi:class I SAM-dependent DNA methyltransferase [Chitinophaga sp. ARDCPP14]|uniref:class I SAM-dependent DNA methyltransferase n=1 Tax=Chitinophaga sp. ARDCPP14 TaxID=3391139 RepID=UPI003F5239FA